MTSAAGPGSLVGPYRLGTLLGRGGMAAVYEATHESVGRTVALKVLAGVLAEDVAFVARFRREGRMQAALEHPHVVSVFEAGTSEYGLYLAMQLVRGPTLAELLAGGALDSARALRLLGQVAGALDAGHRAGLVHRDVKPRNVLVGTGDHAYLADFGLSKVGDASTLTATGQILGTIAYLAPEVVRGEPATPAADRYAFAAMLFECLTGTIVFPRPTQAAMLYAHTSEPPPRASGRRPELPAALDDVLVAALAKEPADRPQSAGEIVQRAAAALAGSDLRAPVAPRPPTTSAPTVPVAVPAAERRRPPALGALACALAGAALTAGAFLLAGGEDASAPAALPPPPQGTQLLGSDLARAGRAVDCRGVAVTEAAPECTIFQERLAKATLIVPADGVVRRWAVRSATGEMALAVLRRSGTGYSQVARSRHEFVGNAEPHALAADLEVDRGDRLAIVLLPGSGIGLRAESGALTNSFIPPVLARTVPAAGPAGELLLRVDFEPGGEARRPAQVTGAEAADLPEGEQINYTTATDGTGDAVEIALVSVDDRAALDLVREGVRVARIDVPDMRPDRVSLAQFFAEPSPTEPDKLEIVLAFANGASGRLLRHRFLAHERQLEFVD